MLAPGSVTSDSMTPALGSGVVWEALLCVLSHI